MVCLAEFLGEMALSVARCSVQACALICLILLIQFALRNRLAPRWRHALWLLLLVKLALPWTPESRWSMFNLVPSSSREARSVKAAAAPDASLKSDIEIAVVTKTQNPRPVRDAENRDRASLSPAPQETSAPRPAFSIPLKQTLALIWLVGAVVLLGCATAQSLALGAAVRRRRFLTDQTTLDLLESCKEEMGIRAYLAVVETPRVMSPALFGFLRPRLLLPEGSIAALGATRLRHVFLHELAHLKRRDIAINWLMTFLQALHWFNPLVWYAFSRMRAEREMAADAQALGPSRGVESREYGRTIVHVLEEFSRPGRLPNLAGILEERSQIRRRIAMITKFETGSRCWPGLALVLAVFLGAVTLTSARSPETDRKEAIDAQTQAEEFVDLLSENDYASASALLGEIMRKNTTPKKLEEIWDDLLERGGAFERVSGLRLERMLADHIAHVTCEFEKGPIDLMVKLDAEKKIADLSFGPTPIDPGKLAAPPIPMGNLLEWPIAKTPQSVSDLFSDLDPPLPRKAETYSVEKLSGPGPVTIIEQPSEKNDFALTVEFDDGSIGGDALYHAKILDVDKEQLYEVKIHLDGRSRLVFKKNTAQWLHFDWQLPGQHYGGDRPTTINGREWRPVFPSPATPFDPGKLAAPPNSMRSIGGFPTAPGLQSFSDLFSNLNPPLPRRAENYSVVALAGPGAVTIIEQPSMRNNFALTVEFDDGSVGGDSLYHARVLNAHKEQLYEVVIQLDGRSRLVFKNDTAQWLHFDWQAPGQHNGGDLPTTINGEEWRPVFSSVRKDGSAQANRQFGAHLATPPASPPLPMKGMGGALFFDGRDDHVTINNDREMRNDPTAPLSLEFWVYVPALTRGSYIMLSKWGAGMDEDDDFACELWDDGRLSFIINSSTLDWSPNTEIASEPGVMPLNAWTHIAYVWNGDERAARIYLNAELVAQSDEAVSTMAWTVEPLRLGCTGEFGAHRRFSGAIDDLRIWNVARAQEAIKADMRRELTGKEQGLAGYWNFNEGEGQLAHDLVTMGNNGVLGSTSTPENDDPAWIAASHPSAVDNTVQTE